MNGVEGIQPTTPLSSSKFNRGVRQMFEDVEISVK
jgi:hypothetical protein